MFDPVTLSIRSYLFFVMPIFHLATFFARRKARTRIGQRDWLKLAPEKIRTALLWSLVYCILAKSSNSNYLIT